MSLRRQLAVSAVVALLAPVAVTQAANLPMKSSRAAAHAWQEHINRNWDPAGRCNVLNRYSFRCNFTDSGTTLTQTFSKAATHKLRVATVVGGVGPVTRFVVLKKTSALYPHV